MTEGVEKGLCEEEAHKVDLADALWEMADDISRVNTSISTGSAPGALPFIYFILNIEGKIIRWNKGANEILGYSDCEILPMKFADWFAEKEAPNAAKVLAEVLKKGFGKLQTLVVAKGGGSIRLELTGTLLEDCRGNPQGIIWIGRNVTSNKKA